MSQALMAPYVNDWLGWFYSGFSGFHPTKIFNTKRDGFTAGTPLSIHQKNKLILLDFRFSFQIIAK